MPILSRDRILLHTTAADKADAIRKAGELLIASGCVQPGYVDGMLARERSMSTSLGVGVAIPHGMDENREDVLHTAISFVQLTDGVEWEAGDKVSLVIGIAATSDEHVAVLAELASVLEDEQSLADLMQTNDPQLVMKYLGEKEAS
jgi:phosphocarrier protein FPr